MARTQQEKKRNSKKTEQVYISPIGICSFPNLARVSDYDGKYSIALLLDQNSKHFDTQVFQSMKKLAAREMVLARKEYGQNAKLVSPFRDAGEKDHLAGYKAGDILVSFRSTTKPVVIDGRQNVLDPDDPEGIYPGCLIRVKHSVFHYNKKGKKGVSFGLTCVQKCGDGERLGHVSTAEGMDDIEIDDGGAELNELFGDSIFDDDDEVDEDDDDEVDEDDDDEVDDDDIESPF